MRVGGALLALVAAAGAADPRPGHAALASAMAAGTPVHEALLAVTGRLLGLVAAIAAFGTAGVLWPLLLLGAWGGAVLCSLFPGLEGIIPLAGGAAFWGAVLGAPLSGAIVAYELTHDLGTLIAALVASLGAWKIRQWLGVRTILEDDLGSQGISLNQGRSVSVLESVPVREAMVKDFDTVQEHESLAEVYRVLRKSHYPFLPVVNAQGIYAGLLTADIIEEACHSAVSQASSGKAPISKLLEAKDILYRLGSQVPTIGADDKLATTIGLFERTAVMPVLGSGRQVEGLLFDYGVRIAYDREVARKSLFLTRLDFNLDSPSDAPPTPEGA
jgi:CBS domain-containing protein